MDVDPNGATWRKSSYSNGTGGNCVEVADLPSGRAVRDSKHPERTDPRIHQGRVAGVGHPTEEYLAELEPGQAATIG